MKHKISIITSLALITTSAALTAFGQSAVIEQTRIGGTSQSNNTDFVFNGFASGTTSDHSSAPGLVSSWSTASRYSAASIPGGPGTNFILSPNAGHATTSNTTSFAGTSALQIGTTYQVSVSFASSPTAASTDIIVSCTDTGMSGIDSINGATSTAFQAGSGYNKWNLVGYITPGTTNPTIQFSYSSGVNGRWNVDSILFSPIPPPPAGTYQYWNTGSPGGTGPWNATAANWNTTSTGSGTQGVFTQGDIANFAGTPGTVTVDTTNGITIDGGLEFDTTGYIVTGGTLTLGSSPATSGTNIAVSPGQSATINSTISAPYGLCSAYLGILNLGAPVSFPGAVGTVTISSGKLQLSPGVSQTFPSLAGTGSGALAIGTNTLTVGTDNTSTTFAGVLSDGGAATPGALIKTGTGTLALNGANTLAGPTTINQGTISVTADSGFGTAPSSLVSNQVTLNGNGAALFSAGSSLTLNAKRGITLNGASNVIAANVVNRTITLASPITGNGSLVIPTGFIEFDASNSFTGDLVFALTNNVSARLESNGCAGLGKIHILPQVTPGNDPITLRNDLAVNSTITNAILYDESVTNAAGYYLAAYLNTTNVGTMTFSGSFLGAASGGVSINDNSSGTSGGIVVLSGDNSAFGSAFNLEGGTLVVGRQSALGSKFVVKGGGSTSTPTLQANTTLTGANAMTNVVFLNLASGFVIGGSKAMEFAGPIHLGAAGGVTLQVTNTAGTIFSGPVDDQGLGLSLTLSSPGSSTLVLAGSNSYSGGTFINSGTLDGNASNSIPGNVTLNSGTLELDDPHAMSPTGTLTVNGGTVDLNFVGFQTNAALNVSGNLPYGIYGATATNPNGVFTGTGFLVVSPAFAITSQSFDTDNNLVVCWQSTIGYTYDVLTNIGLTSLASWQAVNVSPITATNTTTCFTLPGGNTNASVFVAIRADNVTP